MAAPFTVTIDDRGDLTVEAGWVVDKSSGTTTMWQVGTGLAQGVQSSGPNRAALMSVPSFVGGGGDAIEITGTLSGTFCPVGYFQQVDENVWRNHFGTTLEWDPGAGTAEILNGANLIASASGLGALPSGTYASATYGESTYNGGSSFSLTVTHEGGGTDMDVQLMHTSILLGTEAPTGDFTPVVSNFAPSVFGVWVADEDPSWTLQLVGANTELDDGTDVVASGPAVSPLNPESILSSTAYGESTYTSGEPFKMSVAGNYRSTLAGYVFVRLTLSSGSITGVSGPYFAAALPANSSTLEVVPIAWSTGTQVHQIHTGPIHFK